MSQTLRKIMYYINLNLSAAKHGLSALIVAAALPFRLLPL